MDMQFDRIREGKLRKYLRVTREKQKGNIPRLRWLEDVQKDLWEMKVKRRQQKTVNMEEWASVIKEAKALRGLQSQGVNE